MKIGFGKVVITPPIGSSLIGYFVDRRAIGVRDNLYSTSIVFDDGKEICSFSVCDLIWIDKKTLEEVRNIVNEKTGIKKENIFIHATHTHTGPIPNIPDKNSIFQKSCYIEKSYLELLPFYISCSIIEAYQKRKIMKIGVGIERVEGIAFNRRYYLKDGRIVTNPFNQIENIVKQAGPVDNTLYICKVEDRNKNLNGIIINFSLHPDTLGDNLISSDWPGFLRKKIEEKYKDVYVLILNGPSGDINHINPFEFKKRDENITEKISQKIFKKMENVLKSIKTREIKEINVKREEIEIPYREISEKEVKKAKKILKSDFPENSIIKIMYSSLLNIYKMKKKEKKIKTEIGIISLNNKLSFVFCPGEIFAEIGIKIRKNSPFKYTLIAQNSNDNLGYIPSEEAFFQDEETFKINKEYDTATIEEAIGINTSYETSPLGSKVSKYSERILVNKIKKILTS